VPADLPWWVWPLALFAASLALGMVAVVAGIGGGTIFVPVVSGFFPFHLDYVRAAGLLVALAGALAAGPQLLRRDLANLRLAMPVALVASAAAIAGARLGLALPAKGVQIALGVLLLGVLAVMIVAGEAAGAPYNDPLARALGFGAAYWDDALARRVEWGVHRTWTGLGLFVVNGLVAGVFGIGAGWANVPVFNLVMGVPLKLAVGTSALLLPATNTAAAWVYLHQGAVLPLVVVPSVIGMMLGSMAGVRILAVAHPVLVRRVVIVVIALAGVRTLLRGLGIW
jgi:hypothetical protein